MDLEGISEVIFEYTSGYPFLVSKLCQIIDENLGDNNILWTKEGVKKAEIKLRKESNTLFDDMLKQLEEYPDLKKVIQGILFDGNIYSMNKNSIWIQLGVSFGFLTDKNGTVAVANRIFETVIYDWMLSEMSVDSDIYHVAAMNRNQFIVNNELQMDLVMQKFYQYFTEIYADSDTKFVEEQGRKLFLLFLKPIINGTGNYYIEAQTRDMKRTDIIVDYIGKQYVIELKIWHGEEYNRCGEEQLFGYLDFYKVNQGYMLSFNFNKKKKIGIHRIEYNGKSILEVVV